MPVARRLLGPALAAVLLGMLTAPPARATFIAAGTDARADAADPSPARDITAAALGYDRDTGAIRGGVALRGAPDEASRAFVSLHAGVRTPSGCEGYPQVHLASFTTTSPARWLRFDAPGPPAAEGDAARGDPGELQTFEVTDRALAGRRLTCITAVVADPADPNRVFDSVGPLTLEPLPELAARLGRVPSSLSPGRTRTIRLTLRNPGDAATGRIRLSVDRRRGLTVSAPRAVASLRAGQRRTVRLRVRLSTRARTSTPLRVKVTAGKLRVTERATLYLRRPPRGGGGESGGGVCAGYAPVLGGVGEIVTYPC